MKNQFNSANQLQNYENQYTTTVYRRKSQYCFFYNHLNMGLCAKCFKILFLYVFELCGIKFGHNISDNESAFLNKYIKDLSQKLSIIYHYKESTCHKNNKNKIFLFLHENEHNCYFQKLSYNQFRLYAWQKCFHLILKIIYEMNLDDKNLFDLKKYTLFNNSYNRDGSNITAYVKMLSKTIDQIINILYKSEKLEDELI
ncbi:hypothetical protein COBT_000356 [Conglomerata obtusa]